MKNTLFIIILAGIIPLQIKAQTASENYISHRTMTQSNGNTYMESVDYFDGLGRARETVQKSITPARADLVTFQGYDSRGRKAETWLPTPMSNNGNYSDSLTIANAAKSYYVDSHPYVTPKYDDSPLNRLLRTYGAGDRWYNADKYVKTEYLTNSPTDKILHYAVNFSGNLIKSSYYAAGELLVIRTTDEEGHIALKFKDKLGNTVLIREMNGTEANETFFVYDYAGLLCYVLPPMINDNINPEQLASYAYKYTYDDYRRRITIKHPGCSPINLVYDQRDRIILSQDGNQSERKAWTVYKYDKYGRMVYTGEMIINNTPARLRLQLSNKIVEESFSTDGHVYPMEDTGYSQIYYRDTPTRLLTVNYYDDYRFLDLLPAADKTPLTYREQPGYGSRHSSAKGKLTGTRTYAADGSGFTTTAYYYNSNGNIIQTNSTNYANGYDFHFYQLTFTGKISGHRHEQYVGRSKRTTEVYIYNYDHAERLIGATHFLNEDEMPICLFSNTYDELGRLKSKQYGFNNDKLLLNYTYNIRNWQTSMSSPLYYENLAYDDIGNVIAYQWRFQQAPNIYQQYDYTYDGLNRLKSAYHTEMTSQVGIANRYSMEIGGYDKHGNILNLCRRGINYTSTTARIIGNISYKIIDDLTFTYDGNRLYAVSDASDAYPTYKGAMHFIDGANLETEYRYDLNGNMVYDANKGIDEITYTDLNLPQQINFKATTAGGYKTWHSIYNIYDAAGKKLGTNYTTETASVISSGTSTGGISRLDSHRRYLDNMVYENDTLSKIIIPGGYISKEKYNTFTYHYYIKDYLGNNRLVVTPRGQVEQVNHYYPFGALFGNSTNTSVQSYKYAGKELERMHGLDWYDFEARSQDPVIGRFWTMDPLCEKYYSISPYAYCLNNPLKYIDPSGEDVYGFDLFTGRLSLIEMTNNPFDRIMNGSFDDKGVFIPDNENNYLDIIGGILQGKYFDDLSYSGIVFPEGNLSEGINVMRFLSFNSHMEFSAWAYKSSSGIGLSISPWVKNKPIKDKDGTITTPAKDYYEVGERVGYLGDKLFHIHTHPGLKNGMGGYGKPSDSDFYQIKIHPNYPHYIISKKDGIIQYYTNETWKKSAIK